MSMAAWPSIRPAIPLSACARAASRAERRNSRRSSKTSSGIITSPPIQLAAMKRQPMSVSSTRPSSSTRLVEATSKAMAAEKSPPLRTTARAIATAA